ncbi:hypothetical protein BO70DRAFT_432174 [Aspergillus heteromorphus CBS 117.55]|uniref:Uncharacterized protein n=1 Tax=Aspergillus heteromorphus CBS 117.55 TaxID=1448321 RepID=A0A317VBZ1_9EURO|nr:uncharacterized protein BO70DRAFT_432174 [Aspergillus heteromorphus CBS 117.55]PWY70472.1 hypothetical protein BO70DRAFT_432174 [Aspergillus heteromorphus CBS 117.55]
MEGGPNPEEFEFFNIQLKDVCIPEDIYSELSPELQELHAQCIIRASDAMIAQRHFMHQLIPASSGLCSSDDKPRHRRHEQTISHLYGWKKDMDPTDPTLAPRMKIPRHQVYLYADRAAYEEFAERYRNKVQEYRDGLYKLYRDEVLKIDTCRQQVEPADLYVRYSKWWTTTFMAEMQKWEGRIGTLLPLAYEIVVEAVYMLLYDSVEEGPDVAREFALQANCPVDISGGAFSRTRCKTSLELHDRTHFCYRDQSQEPSDLVFEEEDSSW